MKIKIIYESKFSLSTLINQREVIKTDGELATVANSDKSVLVELKEENDFLKNIKQINKKYKNYKYADITQDTVLGILCRLTGEVRRLNRLEDDHPIRQLKNKILFENINKTFSNEIIRLHTVKKEAQDSACGVIDTSKSNNFILSKNKLSDTLFSIFEFNNKKEILSFLNKIKNNDNSLFYSNYNKNIKTDSFEQNLEESLLKYKNLIKSGELDDFYFEESPDVIWKMIGGTLYKGDKDTILKLESELANLTDKSEIRLAFNKMQETNKENKVVRIINIFGVLFAVKLQFLQKHNLFLTEFNQSSLNKNKTSLTGLAPDSGGFTKREFYGKIVGKKKEYHTMPYLLKTFSQQLVGKSDDTNNNKWLNGKINLGVTKECGELNIIINVDEDTAKTLASAIENAAVNTFHLGKKGLAYVSQLELN